MKTTTRKGPLHGLAVPWPMIAFALLGVLPNVVSAATPDKPNVLLVMTDDQGYGDFSLHGNPLLETPHLDRFAREGVRFLNFQVSPFCSPTRASLLTGRYSLRTGVTSVTHGKEVMRNTEVTLAEALRTAGYRSVCIGKWHNGEQFPHTAIGQGFDEFFGFNGGHYVTYFDPVLLRGTQSEQTRGYITDLLTDEAIAFIERNRSQPFFCYVAFNAPHTPTQVPDRFFDAFRVKGLDDRLSAVYGMCRNIDENFGRLLAALDRLQIRDKTLVLFTTDNGAAEPASATGEGRYNAGMRGYKTSVHEGGTRVPLFVQGPGVASAGRTVRQPAAHIDLFPTLLDLCGVERPLGPAIDGLSLVPWLQGKEEIQDRRIFIMTNQAVPARPFPGAVRTSRYRCVCETGQAEAEQGTWQLYDMEADPGEKNDIAAKHPELVRDLSGAYVRWWSETRGGYDPPHRIEIGHATENPVTLHAAQAGAQVRELKYDHGPGFALDWLTGWTSLHARAAWSVEVVTPGEYAVELLCNVREEDAGARIRVSAAGSSAEAVTRPFPGERIVPPNRDRREDASMYLRTWDRLFVGTLKLRAGSTTLAVEALAIPGREAMTLNGVTLKYVRGP